MSDRDAPLRKNDVGMILLTIVALVILDIGVDLYQGVDLIHIEVETLILPVAAWGLLIIWRDAVGLRSKNRTLRSDLAKASSDALQWKKEAERYISGLSDAIDAQLGRWNLTPAEKEVALLILKGLSHKEIARIRNTAERTVRQQSLAVYEKSGLGGRAELSAFFLEDLLVLNGEPASES